ncbi:hypothetical protein LCGC14_1113150 [marine sediment metagenome]|uniref:Uncharacterized protein n=1 Tax=marine sediment metagenome TaxID=412755 RepID=A0A0F9MAX8_9ZZZZ
MSWGKRRQLGCGTKLLLVLLAILVATVLLRELGLTVQDAMKEMLGQSGL